jgi:hypothetical protein
MIIEGLLTTEEPNGSPHVAPMGPVVNEALTQWTLRPFQSSTTFKLLRAHPHCVFHVVDDVLPVVQAALGMEVDLDYTRWSSLIADGLGADNPVWVIPTACRCFHLKVIDWDLSQPRSVATAEVVDQLSLRPFWGWNRAKHAVLEATILATRLHLVERSALSQNLAQLDNAIAKTAGPREQQAWSLLQEYFARSG